MVHRRSFTTAQMSLFRAQLVAAAMRVEAAAVTLVAAAMRVTAAAVTLVGMGTLERVATLGVGTKGTVQTQVDIGSTKTMTKYAFVTASDKYCIGS